MDIIITITDAERDILRTHLLDPEQWIKNVLSEKIRRCADRVYEETTGKIARKKTPDEKRIELADYDLTARTTDDARPILTHVKKRESQI